MAEESLFEAWDIKRNVLIHKFPDFSSWQMSSLVRYDGHELRNREDLNLKLPSGEWWDPYNTPYDHHRYPATSLYEEIIELLEPTERVKGVRLSVKGDANTFEAPIDRMLNWEEAIPALKQFTSSWGPKGIILIAWTDISIILTEGYDTSSWLTKIPRHSDPDFIPEYVGGGC